MKQSARSSVLAAAILGAVPVAAQTPAQIDALLRSAVEQKRVPLVVAVIADAHGVVYEHAEGTAPDAIFRIASMTKPVTSVAVMQLVEAGKVKLDEPAATYVPELAELRVFDHGSFRAPKSPPTVRQLLTHTAGFGYELFDPDLAGLAQRKEIPSMAEGGDAFLRAPLVFDPGTRWEYGINTDWAGRLVERVSGQSLEAYFREHIFAPLGMSDSFFDVPADKQSRVVRVFQRKADGTLDPQPPAPAPPSTARRFYSGGGGLHSTAADYLKFVRALLGGGRLADHRILSEASVAMMGKNQIGDLAIQPIPSLVPQLATDRAVLPGAPDKFGLGFALNTKTADTPRGANTMSWAGLYNTFFWIDRERQVGAVLMTQMLPFGEPGVKDLVDGFDRAVYAWRVHGTR
jgi:methyl acetate hydrolase